MDISQNSFKNVQIKDIIFQIQNNNFVNAEKLCLVLLKNEPDNSEALYFLGFIQLALNKFEESKKYFSQSVDLAEKSLGVRTMSIADSYNKAQMYDDAIIYYKKALVFSPEKAENIYNKLGIIYRTIHKYDYAKTCYETALKINPDYIEALANLGLAHKECGDFANAEKYCQKALSINNLFAPAYYYLGLVYVAQNKPMEAIPFIKKAIEINPDYKDPYGAYSFCLLVTKNFEEGWKAYENRFKGLNTPVPAGNKPKWQGEDLTDKRLYVFYEQGFGDSIQFLRYIPLLQDKGVKVYFKPQPELETLISQSDLGIEIVDKNHFLKGEEFDYYSMLLSLPHYLKATDKNIPFPKCYLKADKTKVKSYYDKYFKNIDKFKVGIFWQGSKTFANDKNRSMMLEKFYELSKLKNVQLYSLQKGFGEEQLENIPEDINIIRLGNTFNDFSDTAAAIENLDLVISVDSSIAHLAGALGKPVWILLSYVWEWRWFGADEKTPWYDSMKIFHQQKADSWENVIKKVYKELKKVSKN